MVQKLEQFRFKVGLAVFMHNSNNSKCVSLFVVFVTFLCECHMLQSLGSAAGTKVFAYQMSVQQNHASKTNYSSCLSTLISLVVIIRH